MSNTYVLMTAMPPTKGHLALIEFAHLLTSSRDFVYVILCTQPSEPFSAERFEALSAACRKWHNVMVWGLHKEISQDATKPEFWDMWKSIMANYGMTKDDLVISSESYGQKVADLVGAKFMPYDPARELQDIKATNVRKRPADNFEQMIPEFQTYMRKTVTVFGAESVGKTTISKMLADRLNGHWRFEYARPYLEMVGNEITDEKMIDIFDGQEAIQTQTWGLKDKPFVFQDTDLYSTIGYWEMWKDERAPVDWYPRAEALKSDLYIILSSDIPFEADPLRYGGDVRESTDQYWIDLCKREGLKYRVVNQEKLEWRLIFAALAADSAFYTEEVFALMDYQRKHNG